MNVIDAQPYVPPVTSKEAQLVDDLSANGIIDPGDTVARERLAALDEARIDARPPYTAKPPKAHWLQLLVSGRSTRASSWM
mgnify:CR=1 FL=1